MGCIQPLDDMSGARAARARLGSRLAAGGLAMLAASMAYAQIYECSNARGLKQYAQFCPAGTVNQRLVFTGGPVTAAGGSGSLELQAAQFRRRAQEREEAEAKAEKARSEAVYALHNCIEARGRLRGLEEGQRFSREDAITGERIQFSDEERLADVRRQRTTAEQWCTQ